MMDDEHKAQVAAYNAERDALLIEGDLDKMLAFLRRNRPEAMPSDRFVLEIMLHQCRTAVRTLPMELRKVSKHWLLERGYRSWDDGDVVIE